MPDHQPLPPVRPPQVRIVGWYRMLLPLPGADDERVVGLDSHHTPERLDRVGVEVTVGCGRNLRGVRAGVQGAFLLSVHHHVTGAKPGRHVALPSFLSRSPSWRFTRILRRRLCCQGSACRCQGGAAHAGLTRRARGQRSSRLGRRGYQNGAEWPWPHEPGHEAGQADRLRGAGGTAGFLATPALGTSM
jgi:hypothetical protein